ncbi:hypothetical protein [Ktedonospora formicarum]|uniref:Transposase n=1 Tax=Ktedonospora formicarum TaxID=2778364 RepID=A0A8J3I8G1_9CHLR|nr:hypothetical protein [Ktedonospora formicarum]GHO51419.1 hypothetical protein KSX_95820 [Ktedonospora formicarum]
MINSTSRNFRIILAQLTRYKRILKRARRGARRSHTLRGKTRVDWQLQRLDRRIHLLLRRLHQAERFEKGEWHG